MNINKYITSEKRKKPGAYDCVPRIRCKDGFTVSVQAHAGSYSEPRGGFGPWSQVELGFPSEKPNDNIMQYAEDLDRPTQTVYGYVPVELVEALIEEHGGQVVEVEVKPTALIGA